MTRFIYLFTIALLFNSCKNDQEVTDDTLVIEAVDSSEPTPIETKTIKTQDEPALPTSPRLSGKYTIKAYLTDSLGWGYTILEGTKVVVNQPHIPAVQGLKGFSSEARAKRAGEEVAFKLEQGIVPPTLTVAELKAIKVID